MKRGLSAAAAATVSPSSAPPSPPLEESAAPKVERTRRKGAGGRPSLPSILAATAELDKRFAGLEAVSARVDRLSKRILVLTDRFDGLSQRVDSLITLLRKSGDFNGPEPVFYVESEIHGVAVAQEPGQAAAESDSAETEPAAEPGISAADVERSQSYPATLWLEERFQDLMQRPPSAEEVMSLQSIHAVTLRLAKGKDDTLFDRVLEIYALDRSTKDEDKSAIDLQIHLHDYVEIARGDSAQEKEAKR